MTTDAGRKTVAYLVQLRARRGRLADQAGPVRHLVHLPGRPGPLPRVEERRRARPIPDLPEPGVGLHDGPREHRRRAHPALDGLGGAADRLGPRPGELPEAGRYVLRQHHGDRQPDADGHDRASPGPSPTTARAPGSPTARSRVGSARARPAPTCRTRTCTAARATATATSSAGQNSTSGQATRGRLQDGRRQRLHLPERRADHRLAQPEHPPADRQHALSPSYAYRLMPKHVSGKSVDVAYGSTINGTAVQQWAKPTLTAQKFAILASGTNWKIAMKSTPTSASARPTTAPGTSRSIEIQDCNGSSQPGLERHAGLARPTRSLQERGGEPLPGGPGRSTADGARLQIYDCTGVNNQKFSLAAS